MSLDRLPPPVADAMREVLALHGSIVPEPMFAEGAYRNLHVTSSAAKATAIAEQRATRGSGGS